MPSGVTSTRAVEEAARLAARARLRASRSITDRRPMSMPLDYSVGGAQRRFCRRERGSIAAFTGRAFASATSLLAGLQARSGKP
jgi:hypothetical protein